MKALLAVALLLATSTSNVWAHTACLQGEYRDQAGKLVLNVSSHHHDALLVEQATGARYSLRMLPAADRQVLWQQQGWKAVTMKGVECGGDKARQHIVCMLSLPGGEPAPQARGFNSVYVVAGQPVQWLHLQ